MRNEISKQTFFFTVFYEPTDVIISRKPFQTKYWSAIKYITPNLTELKYIASLFDISFEEKPNEKMNLDECAFLAREVAEHVDTVILTLGAKGLMIARRYGPSDKLYYNEETKANNPTTSKLKRPIQVRHYEAPLVDNIVNVSGAGDCLASGVIVAMLNGLSEEKCVSVGFQSALGSLKSNSPVPEVLFDKNHKAWSTNATYNLF